ncbi:MAG: phosphoribosylamine--glycine ligase [Candidatus Tumulicola sp.]
MRILVVGSGAREDALSWRLAQSASCEAIFAAPGNAGTASRGENWTVAATDGKALAERCLTERIDCAVLGPETAIAAGVGDRLREAGISVFGPNRSAGRLESSKVFAKRFMERHGIPTARGVVVHSLDGAVKALESWSGGVVVKADGLAAGKGVVVCDSPVNARTVLAEWYAHNKIPGGGSDVLLEEVLAGREVSVFALADGRAMAPIAAACDYKRAGDGNTGPNTGGMGAYSPPAGFPDDLDDQVRQRILAPVLRGLLAEGEEYAGVLYCGLMWTADGPYVIEFNVRFGDPEAQVLMPRVRGDFAALIKSAADGAMDLSLAAFSPESCLGVVLATSDYPRSNTPLKGLNADVSLGDGRQAFWGGSTLADGHVNTGGGRVLTVTALGDDLPQARGNAYAAVKTLASRLGTNALTYRTDIGT